MRTSYAFGMAFGAALIGGGLALAVAQPAPPPGGPGMMDQMPHGPGGMMPPHGPGMGPAGWAHHAWRRAPMGGPMGGLVFTAKDRALSGADVQKIAEAFLLFKGNHSWKVTEVAEQDAANVAFALATQNGDVIARFTMDRHDGRVRRVS